VRMHLKRELKVKNNINHPKYLRNIDASKKRIERYW